MRGGVGTRGNPRAGRSRREGAWVRGGAGTRVRGGGAGPGGGVGGNPNGVGGEESAQTDSRASVLLFILPPICRGGS